MTKTKRTFEAETVTLPAMRLEKPSPRTRNAVRPRQVHPRRVSALVTRELILKIIETIKAL